MSHGDYQFMNILVGTTVFCVQKHLLLLLFSTGNNFIVIHFVFYFLSSNYELRSMSFHLKSNWQKCHISWAHIFFSHRFYFTSIIRNSQKQHEHKIQIIQIWSVISTNQIQILISLIKKKKYIWKNQLFCE